MNKLITIFIAFILTVQLSAVTITLDMQYQEAATGNICKQKMPLEIVAPSVSDAGMHKTLFAIKLCALIKSSLVDYHETLSRYGTSCYCMPNPQFVKNEHARRLSASIENLNLFSFGSDPDVQEALQLAKMLSENMRTGEFGPVFTDYNHATGIRPMMKMESMPMAAALHVTTGGVQDYSHCKKQIQDGFVPVPEAFIEEGFLRSFTLGLEVKNSDNLLSVNPQFAWDKETNKLYIQVDMSSAVDAETFKRPPLNIAFVIDISGSMAATDNTERTRLEWAKEASCQAVSHLNEHDIVSLVVFDSKSTVILKPTEVLDKSAIIRKIQAIQIGGSTNLDAGLRDGYLLASLGAKSEYQNRVMLFSDAGLNTGVTDHSSIVRLVSDYAAENIGLTAIGMGENFHHDFIHKISMSKGGNALFVHSGSDMMKFFRNFDYLVTPIAYNLKLTSEVVEGNAKFVKAYGVPKMKDEPVQELINIRTLFFTQEGGGAIVLEYDL